MADLADAPFLTAETPPPPSEAGAGLANAPFAELTQPEQPQRASTGFLGALQRVTPPTFQTGLALAAPGGIANIIHKAYASWLTENEGGPRPAKGVFENLQAGYQGSVPGMAFRRKLPELIASPENQTWMENLARGVGGIVPELPLYMAGGVLGAAFKLPALAGVGAVGAGSGSTTGVDVGVGSGVEGVVGVVMVVVGVVPDKVEVEV